MDYCMAGDDDTAAIWNGQPDLDLDGDGRLDAVGLDFDGDGMHDDALADFDGDGIADHAVLDLDNDGTPEAYFTDDGSGTWAVAVDRGGQLRWTTTRKTGSIDRSGPKHCRPDVVCWWVPTATSKGFWWGCRLWPPRSIRHRHLA